MQNFLGRPFQETYTADIVIIESILVWSFKQKLVSFFWKKNDGNRSFRRKRINSKLFGNYTSTNLSPLIQLYPVQESFKFF